VADESAEAVLSGLRERGAQIELMACDVTDPLAVESLLVTVRAGGHPLRGIIHAASVYDDGMARNLDASRILGVLAPKISGALNLDRYTRAEPPDFFVVLSSATTLFGNPGQAAYVAANHWLETFATARAAQGLTTCCLGLGPIEDAGYLARNPRLGHALADRLGGRSLRVEEALRALETHLLTGSGPRALVDFRWPTLSRHLRAANTPRFSALAAMDGTTLDRPAAGSGLQEQLRGLAGPELRVLVIAHLRSEIGAVLNLAAAEIDPATPAHALGLDSLMGVELAVAIESSFGVKIPEMGMGEESVESLATRIIRLLVGEEREPEPATLAEEHALQFLKKHEASTLANTILDPEARISNA
jgi:acyl carrier protein/NAD(P)-dependent dehydrogenase (short-subunit alcohol dehydrogenase family)